MFQAWKVYQGTKYGIYSQETYLQYGDGDKHENHYFDGGQWGALGTQEETGFALKLRVVVRESFQKKSRGKRRRVGLGQPS